MRKTLYRAGSAIVSIALIALVGCTNPTESESSDDPEVWGYVAAAESAQLDVTEDQLGAETLVVDRVLVPGDAWVVVHADDDGKPGMRVGLARVEKGESTGVRVELEDVTTPKVIVAIHADRGTKGEFDFDMMNPTMSPDRPYFVDEKELAAFVTVREFGVTADENEAAIDVSDQDIDGTIFVDRALAPTPAWIVVHLDDDGAPGQRVGLLHIPAGEITNAVVDLDPLPLTSTLFVAVHADRGEQGVFEFDMMDKINSPDQPFFIDGTEVAKAISVR
ncbi:MAG: DUF7282 domain-containing protein [Coriobacteriia bacterium]